LAAVCEKEQSLVHITCGLIINETEKQNRWNGRQKHTSICLQTAQNEDEYLISKKCVQIFIACTLD
jgi:hypothetical protein